MNETSKRTILLVEDDAILAMSGKMSLHQLGYDVVVAHTGEKAVQVVFDDTLPVDLILMDIDLGPGIDGTEAAEKVLNYRDIPVVFLSSHTEPEVVEKTEKITSYGYVVKDSGITVLDASIKMAFKLFEAKIREQRYKTDLLHSRDLMRYVIEHTRGAVAVHDRDLKYVYVSKQYLDQYNVHERDVIGKHHYEVFPDLPLKFRDAHQRALRGEVSRGEDDAYKRDDGTVAWTRWECRPWYEADDTIGGFVVYSEVLSNEPATRMTTQDTVNYLRSILRTTRDGFDVVDMSGRILDVNDAHCEMFGYTREEFLELSISDIDPDETPDLTAQRTEYIRSTGHAVFDARGLRKDATVFDVEVSASFLGGEKDRIVAFYRDITERKKFENELKKQKDFLQNIINNGFDFVSLTDIYGNYSFVGNSYRFFGYDEEYLLGKNLTEIFDPENINNLDAALSEWLQNNETQVKGESRVLAANGSYIWVESLGKKLLGKDGEIKELLWSNRDISERKQAEEHAIGVQDRLQKIIDNSPLLIHEIDTSGHYVLVNEATCTLLNIAKDDLLGKHFEDVLPSEAAVVFRERIDHLVMTGKQMTVDDTLHIDGQDRVFRTMLFPIFRHRGSLPTVIGMGYEITKEIHLLKEKDFLMQELNHRVKNNLAMISSLINLKASEAAPDLSDIQRQIEAVGLIHEKLYQTGNVTEICVKDYIGDLVTSIFSSFTSRRVRIEKDIDDFCVSTKVAVPLGLIVNEIATNAVKHGFSDDKEAFFFVKMKKDTENGRYALTLSNTGNAFPEEIDLNNPQTLGLRLISALTGQLGGTIELQRVPHPVFSIRFGNSK
ncbi:MAG: PAS domain S-box protein [Spirochaetaceae bacterium]|nr:MAG: PAS domain S-box protein [Spirochaetaceae bacterium]